MITIIDPLKLPALNFKDEFLSAKIKANFLSYGGNCSFLFLWCQKSNQDITAIICKFEQSVIIVANDDADFGEIKDFLNVVGFSSIQSSPVVFKSLGLDYTEYQVVFKASKLGGALPPMPNLKEAYDILFSEENPHIKKVPFDSFYVDLCHRIRHGTAAAVLNHSSVCIASHITSDAAVISGVATKKNSRKTGSGSEALNSLCENLDGRKIFVAAEASVTPFYIKNGFEACGKTAIYSIKELRNMLDFFNISERLCELDEKALKICKSAFEKIDSITEYNQLKVLRAFINGRVSESNFNVTTGYGYGDKGRDDLDKILAEILGAEDALIRHSFASGTHTLTVALFGVLRPGDKMLCVTGRPYDTLIGVLGCDEKVDGSLADFGVEYKEVALNSDGMPDLLAIEKAVKAENPKMVYIQRSRGYSLRPSLRVADIEKICKAVRATGSDAIIMVDNCYGEFVEKTEPTEVGADLIAGSLIKNPGGGIAPSGGYIAGRADLVEKCAFRMTAPGVGREVGASLGHNRELYMGIFNAPHITGEALKAAVYASALFTEMGFGVTPVLNEDRADIIQAILLERSDRLIAFCKGLQSGAPVDSHLTPEPWDMPGYDDQVIMAAGAFTLGSSIELSADAPLREPFAVWMQGGLNFHTARAGILMAAEEVLKCP